MSLSRLLVATRNTLRSHLENIEPFFLPEEIRVMPDDKPAPYCGEKFISISGSKWAPRSPDYDMEIGIAEEYDLVCALTMRSPMVPQDDQGEELYIKYSIGMEDVCRQIVIALHKNFLLIREANELIAHPTMDDIIEPLRWKGTDPRPQLVGPDWFYVSPSPGGGYEHIQSGMVMRVYFGDAFRAQNKYERTLT